MKKWESDLVDLLKRLAEKKALAPEKMEGLKKQRTAYVENIVEPALFRIDDALKKQRFYLRRDKRSDGTNLIDVFKIAETDAVFEFDIIFDIADDALWVRLGSDTNYRRVAEVDEDLLGSTFTAQFEFAVDNPDKAMRRLKIEVI